MVELDHEVVGERPEESTDVRHDPGDPEEVVPGRKGRFPEPGNQCQETTGIKGGKKRKEFGRCREQFN